MEVIKPRVAVRGTRQGEVEIHFLLPNGQPIMFALPAEDAGRFSSEVLNAAYQASVILNDLPAADPAKVQEVLVLPATNLGSGKFNGRETMVICIGATLIAFAVNEEKLSTLGSQLFDAYWRTTPGLTLRTAAAVTLRNVLRDLSGLRHLFWSRAVALARLHWNRLAKLAAGKSLRIFRSVSIDPDTGLHPYDAVGRCIYCGATEYAPGSDRKLGGEHIIAEGLGSSMELPEASCFACEKITGALIEGQVLLHTLKALRLHLELRGKKRPPPETLPLFEAGTGRRIDIPVEDYPVVFWFPVYGEPAIFSGGSGGAQPAVGMAFVILKHDKIKMARQYGVQNWSPARWDTHMLFRMLAKMAHAFAEAEMPGTFKPALLDVIRLGSDDAFNHIGGEPVLAPRPRNGALHEIALGYQRRGMKDYLVARIRLFARHGGPVYYVVVGESLESSRARLRRFFSRRSSRTYVRQNSR